MPAPQQTTAAATAALIAYLDRAHEVHTSAIAAPEISYYPALDLLFSPVGALLSPKVLPISQAASRGAGTPDYTLQVETTRDLRAVVEVKPASVALADLIASEQVRTYLATHHLCIATNLRQFALVRLRDGHEGSDAVETIMEYTLAESERAFWLTPSRTLAAQHGAGFGDFLLNAFAWDAPLTRPKDLAESLARYAREALRRLEQAPAESLTPLRTALAEALGLHFTDEQGEHFFRSSLVQTLFYGLFSAWAVWRRTHPNAQPERFIWQAAGDHLSLPVLRELFEHIAIASQLESLTLRQPLEWAEATLRRTAWEPFAAAFEQGDAVNYFYEPFLEAYDPDLREELGVWYTPREIITYQVARVDRLLREELGIADGLADDRVVVLDPATGTGGYLLEVLRVIGERLTARGAGALRGMQMRHAATTRIFGFEILPAPFVVAHLQIAALLAASGATLTQQDRAGVYLTNALTGWKQQDAPNQPRQLTLEQWPALKKEMQSATSVKHGQRILVILGNPPYNAKANSIREKSIEIDEEAGLLDPYYTGIKERFSLQPRSLNEMYVRFFRLAERQIAERTGQGVVSFISGNSWLDGLSHPIMREHIMNAFDNIWIDNLNGGGMYHGSRGPDNKPDRSIFEYVGGQGSVGITVATAITTMVRTGQTQADFTIAYRDVWGQGQEKRQALADDAKRSEADLKTAYRLITPTESTRFTLKPGGTESAYLGWPALDDLFVQQFPGVKTSRDTDLVSIEKESLRQRMQAYYDASRSDEEIAALAPVLMQDASRYEAKPTRQELLKKSSFREDRLIRVAYRPLDDRWLYWEGMTKLLDEKRTEYFEQVFPGNVYLAASTKSRRGVNLPTITDKFSSLHLQDPYSLYFPLYIKQIGQPATHLFEAEMPTPQGPQPNFAPKLFAQVMQAYGADETERNAIAERLFYHILAVSRSPLYEEENEGYLMNDWPRIPIPARRDLLEASAALGRRVGDLLRPDVPFTPSPDLPEVASLAQPARIGGGQLSEADLSVTIRYNGAGRYEPVVADGPTARPSRLWWNEVGYWENVPEEVWSFTIGGYPVIKKWLDYRHRDRLKRPLTHKEVLYVSEMVRRIATLLALGPALDASYLAVKAETLTLNV